jgi:DHA1 family tetracycline resistance protein-like MFS transporter
MTIFIDVTGFGIVLPLLPYYAAALGVGETALGALVASFALMQVISSPILGRLSDRTGRRPVLILSIITSIASFILFALANSFWMLLLSRIVAGLASEISVAQAYIADITEEKDRAKGMGRVGAAHGAGFIIGPAMGGFLSTYGFSTAGWAAALLALVNLLFVILFLPESRNHTQENPKNKSSLNLLKGLEQTLTFPFMGSILLILFIISFAFSSFPVVMPLLAMSFFGIGSLEMSYFFVYVGLVQIVFQGFVVGKMANKIGEEKLMIFGLTVMTLGILFMAIFPNLAFFFILSTVVLIGFGALNTSIPSYISKVTSKEKQGGTLGVTQSISGIARVPGPIIGGAIFEYAGASAPFLLSALLLIVATTFSIRITTMKPAKSTQTKEGRQQYLTKNTRKWTLKLTKRASYRLVLLFIWNHLKTLFIS